MKLEGKIYNFGQKSVPVHIRAIAAEVRERLEICDYGDGDDEARRGGELGRFLEQLAKAVEERERKTFAAYAIAMDSLPHAYPSSEAEAAVLEQLRGLLDPKEDGAGTIPVPKASLPDPLVFLEDHSTFSPIDGAAILLGNYDRAYDIRKVLQQLTPEQLRQCEVAVDERMVEAAQQGLE